MDPRLIKANIALFNGGRSEVRRLVADYIAEMTASSGAANGRSTGAYPHRTMALWLEANAQDAHDDRIARLQKLVADAPASDRYVRLATTTLEEEREFDAQIEVPGERSRTSFLNAPVFGVALWKVLAIAAVGLLLGVVVVSAFNVGGPDAGTLPAAGVVGAGTPPPNATPLPDNSVAIDPATHRVTYPQGVIELTAYEDRTARAIDAEALTPLTPFAEARFFALKLVFECRLGLCSAPPEGTLALRLADGAVVPQIEGAGIAGEPLLLPVAQNGTTTGWAVFQVPVRARIAALLVVPNRQNNQELPPVEIPLDDLEGPAFAGAAASESAAVAATAETTDAAPAADATEAAGA
jgi:hypothetical protein